MIMKLKNVVGAQTLSVRKLRSASWTRTCTRTAPVICHVPRSTNQCVELMERRTQTCMCHGVQLLHCSMVNKKAQ